MGCVLFCNIAYMQFYDFALIKETPKHGGKYVADTGDAYEKYNFHICIDGKIRGFVETKYRDGSASAQFPRQIRIENIDPQYKKSDKIDGVTVVFCAHSDILKKSVIVGWYKDATVYRNRLKYKGRQYNIECNAENAYLLTEEIRTFIVPRAVNGNFGFGQSNIWYAKDERATRFVESVLEYIDIHSKTSLLTTEPIPQEIPGEYIENGIGKKVLVNKYERNPVARQKCLEIHGTSCTICGFNAAKVYGSEFTDKIEVHHIIPINEINREYRVDPITDLVPVCPNCHMILHSKMSSGNRPTIDMLKLLFINNAHHSVIIQNSIKNDDKMKNETTTIAEHSTIEGSERYIGLQVFHTSPKFGTGVVTAETETTVKIKFDNGKKATFTKESFKRGMLKITH